MAQTREDCLEVLRCPVQEAELLLPLCDLVLRVNKRRHQVHVAQYLGFVKINSVIEMTQFFVQSIDMADKWLPSKKDTRQRKK